MIVQILVLLIQGQLIQPREKYQLYSFQESYQFEGQDILIVKLDHKLMNSTLLFKISLQPLYDDQFHFKQGWPICIISPYMKDVSQFKNLLKNDNNDAYVFYDYEASATGSQYHMIQFKLNQSLMAQIVDYQIYLSVGDMVNYVNSFEVAYTLFYRDSDGCVNDCQQTEINNIALTSRYCNYSECSCGFSTFGSYCQFSKDIIIIDGVHNIEITPYNWKYFQINVVEIKNNDFRIQFLELNNNFILSFGYNGISDRTIPNLHFDSFEVIAAIQNNQQYSLESKMIKYRICVDDFIAFQHSLTSSVQYWVFQQAILEDKASKEINFFEENYIIIIIVSVNLFLIILFFCIAHKFRQRQRNINQRHQNHQQEEQHRPPVRKRSKMGFKCSFLEQYFLMYSYETLLVSYPSLAEHEECVICLESLKQTKSCSLTPCFHLFHHDCLKEWLVRQKYCPFCRATYTEQQLIQMKNWVEIKSQRDQISSRRNDQSQYIKRMKQKSNQEASSFNEDSINVNSEMQFVNNNVNNLSQFEMNSSISESINNQFHKSHEITLQQIQEDEQEEEEKKVEDITINVSIHSEENKGE